MNTSSDLFQLIHSLSRGEVNHFRAYASMHSSKKDKKYLLLFDAIAAQKEYDEEGLKRKFSKEKFVQQLAVAKNYLYKLILHSLELYHAESAAGRRARRFIYQAEILYTRGLMDQSAKLLRKARKLVDSNELTLAELELHRMEQLIIAVSTAPGKELKKMAEQYGLEDKSLQAYRENLLYTRLMRQLSSLINQYGGPRSAADARRYDPVFKYPSLQKGKLPATIRARFFYHIIRAQQRQIEGDQLKALKEYHQLIDLMEAYPHRITESESGFVTMYIAQLHNFLTVAIDSGKTDSYFEDCLQRLAQIPDEPALSHVLTEKSRAQHFVNYHNIRLRYYCATGRFEEGQELIGYIEKELPRHLPPHSILLTELYLNITLLYFFSGKNGLALYWLNQLLNHPYAPDRQDVFGWAKILRIILYLELEETDLLESAIKSTYRYLAGVSRLYASEKILLGFFRKEVPKIANESMLKQALDGLKGQLSTLIKNPYERPLLEHFGILHWLESRISGRPLGNIIRQKSKV